MELGKCSYLDSPDLIDRYLAKWPLLCELQIRSFNETQTVNRGEFTRYIEVNVGLSENSPIPEFMKVSLNGKSIDDEWKPFSSVISLILPSEATYTISVSLKLANLISELKTVVPFRTNIPKVKINGGQPITCMPLSATLDGSSVYGDKNPNQWEFQISETRDFEDKPWHQVGEVVQLDPKKKYGEFGIDTRIRRHGHEEISNDFSSTIIVPDCTLRHIVSYGQSNSFGAGGEPSLSLKQPFSNLKIDPDSGDFQKLIEPTVSIDRRKNVETHVSTMLNLLSARSTETGELPLTFIGTTSGLGGASYRKIKRGSDSYEHLLNSVKQARHLAKIYGLKYEILAAAFIHGESDSLEMTRDYADDVIQFRKYFSQDLSEIIGTDIDIPLFISQAVDNSLALNEPEQDQESRSQQERFFEVIRDAQLSASLSDPKIIFVGPTYSLPMYDHSHLTNVGYQILGEQFALSMHDHLMLKKPPHVLRPSNVQFEGDKFVVSFADALGPIFFNGWNQSPTKGFWVTDQNDLPVPIKSVKVSGPREVSVQIESHSHISSLTLDYANVKVLGKDGRKNEGAIVEALVESPSSVHGVRSFCLPFRWHVDLKLASR